MKNIQKLWKGALLLYVYCTCSLTPAKKAKNSFLKAQKFHMTRNLYACQHNANCESLSIIELCIFGLGSMGRKKVLVRGQSMIYHWGKSIIDHTDSTARYHHCIELLHGKCMV
jgi:hypothetical protein